MEVADGTERVDDRSVHVSHVHVVIEGVGGVASPRECFVPAELPVEAQVAVGAPVAVHVDGPHGVSAGGRIVVALHGQRIVGAAVGQDEVIETAPFVVSAQFDRQVVGGAGTQCRIAQLHIEWVGIVHQFDGFHEVRLAAGQVVVHGNVCPIVSFYKALLNVCVRYDESFVAAQIEVSGATVVKQVIQFYADGQIKSDGGCILCSALVAHV